MRNLINNVCICFVSTTNCFKEHYRGVVTKPLPSLSVLHMLNNQRTVKSCIESSISLDMVPTECTAVGKRGGRRLPASVGRKGMASSACPKPNS